MILVVAATGVLGSEVARKPTAADVRAATRSPQGAQPLAQLSADVVATDLIDPRSLTRDARRLAQDIRVALMRIDAFVRQHARPGGSAG